MIKNVIALSVLIMLFVEGNAQSNESTQVQLILKEIAGEADWGVIKQRAETQYGKHRGDSIMQRAKIEYYFTRKEYSAYIKEFIRFYQDYNLLTNASRKNSAAWRVALYASDTSDLRLAEKWVLEAREVESTNPFFMDTYANIRYKLGDQKRAIELQTTAAGSTLGGNQVTALMENLYRMKSERPTWNYPVAKQKAADMKSEELIWSELEQQYMHRVREVIWKARLNISRIDSNKGVYIQTLIKYLEEYKPVYSPVTFNQYAWEVFSNSNDKRELSKALSWSEMTLSSEANKYAFIDTYANLLYKLGNRKDAIRWEEKAVSLCPEADKAEYQATLMKIKNGEKTWRN